MPSSPGRHFQLVSLVFPLHTSQHGEWEVFMQRSIQKGLCPFSMPGRLQLGLPHGQELPKQSSPRHVSLHWDPPERDRGGHRGHYQLIRTGSGKLQQDPGV